jgi:molybdopterin/thiamine biosynthesis adenylyltransferase/rhodanese-related sulfurtransferase
MTLSPGTTSRDRYVRQRILPGFGHEGQAALAAARVLVIGAGGLGSSVIPSLAGAGVGTIGIVDFDTVEPSNLHRQLIHRTQDAGSLKTTSAAARVAALNPEVAVVEHSEQFTVDNALELCGAYDLVIDGSDNFVTRYLVNDAAVLSGIPAVWGAVSQFGGQAGVAWAAKGPHYRDLFPAPPSDGSVLSCAVGGVFPTTVAIIGSVMASEAIKIITGIGEPLIGRVITFDALTGSFRELAYSRDPDAAPITVLTSITVLASIDDPVAGAAVAAAADSRETGASRTVTAVELAAELASDSAPALLDVREDWEIEVATLPGAISIPLGELAGAIPSLRGTESLVVYCHHGVRSAHALRLLRESGFGDARHLEGGIDSWATTVDPTMERY